MIVIDGRFFLSGGAVVSDTGPPQEENVNVEKKEWHRTQMGEIKRFSELNKQEDSGKDE